MYIALGLSLLLVVGALVGAKLVFQNARQPVNVVAIPAPDAESSQCAELLQSLPAKVLGVKRAEMASEVPGTAVWAKGSEADVTLRCGVDVPFQYTELSEPETIDGTDWFEIQDPMSPARSWYAVNRFPVVAVTTEGDPREDLAHALTQLERKDAPQNPAPLSELAAGPDRFCDRLDLPEQLGDLQLKGSAWVARGKEPIVLRCGVELPEAYQPGVQLTQINDVPWFEDAGIWYALRENIVAVYLPEDSSNLVPLSDAIRRAVPAES